MSVELNKCPWCGGRLMVVVVSEGSSFRWRKVEGCCADGPEVRHDTMAKDQESAEADSRARAIAAWNTRAPLDKAPPRVDPATPDRYRDCCDTPNYCSSSRMCTRLDMGPELDKEPQR